MIGGFTPFAGQPKDNGVISNEYNINKSFKFQGQAELVFHFEDLFLDFFVLVVDGLSQVFDLSVY